MLGGDGEVGSLVRRALVMAAVLALAAGGIAYVAYGAQTALSIVAGGGVAMASFLVLVAVVVRGTAESGRGMLLVAVIGIGKLLLLGALLWWLITRGHVAPLAFLGGFSTMVAALLIEALRLSRSKAMA